MKLRAMSVVVLLTITACVAQSPTQSPLSSESPLPTASESPSPMATTTPSASASEAASAFAPDTMVRALLSGISVRAEAALSAERYGTLPEGSRSFVVSGPVEADGYTWIQIAGPGLPPASGCATFPGPEFSCPTWFGWAAVGDPETGEPWFVDDPTDCPDPGLETAVFMTLGDVEALHCYGSQEIQFTGWIAGRGALREPPGCFFNDAPMPWLLCPENYSMKVRANDAEVVNLEIFVDPESGLELAYPGHWPIVVGHFDDPDAADCALTASAGLPADPTAAVLACRTRFVLTLLGGVGP